MARRMIPLKTIKDIEAGIAGLEASKTEAYVGTFNVEETDWSDGLQGQEVEIENEYFTEDNIIIISEDTEEGRANYELIRDLEIIPQISEEGVLKLVANTHDTISGDAAFKVVVLVKSKALPEPEPEEEESDSEE